METLVGLIGLMDPRVPLAVALLALFAAVGLLGWSLHCGARTVDAVGPGEQMDEPACASYVSPGDWLSLGGAALGVVSVVRGRWMWTAAVGAVMMFVGFPLMLSAGPVVIVVGSLIALAGVLQRFRGPTP